MAEHRARVLFDRLLNWERGSAMLGLAVFTTALVLLFVPMTSRPAASQPTPGGDCCAEHHEPGCDIPVCQDCVCALDASCCDQEWDGICAARAREECEWRCSCESLNVCTGDCDGNGGVAVSESILGINIALNHAPISVCPAIDRNGDGRARIDELTAQVYHALKGCGSTPLSGDARASAASLDLLLRLPAGVSPGNLFTLEVHLTTNDEEIVAFEHEIRFPAGGFGDWLNCWVSSHVSKDLHYNVLSNACFPGLYCPGIHAIVTSLSNLAPIPDGLVYSCSGQIPIDATPGSTILFENRGRLGSNYATDALALAGSDGAITIQIDQWYFLRPLGNTIRALAMDPWNSQTIYAGTEGGQVSKSTDGGLLWTTAKLGVDSQVTGLAVDASDPDVLYAATAGSGVFKSSDGGTTWLAVNAGLTNLTINALVIDPLAPATLYAGTDPSGVFKSTNGGASWAQTNSGLNSPFVLALALDPSNPSILYAGTDGAGVFKSSNGGASWTAANAGLSGVSVSTLAVDPETPDTVYAGGFLGGVFKTDNGGLSWSAASTGLLSETVYALAIDPVTPATVYAGTNGGAFRSTDGAVTWQAISGASNLAFLSLAIDPVSPATVYGGTDSGIFKRTNAVWIDPWGGLRDATVTALVVDPQTPETLYAGTGTLFGDGGVYKSTDGGVTWTAANVGLGNVPVFALAIDPQTPETLYAGTGTFFGDGGVYKSTDGGTSWTAANVGLGNVPVSALAIDPQTPETLYAGKGSSFGIGGGVYKSTDGGTSWTAANVGLGDVAVSALAIDPQTPTTIYATGNGHVYRSRTAGALWQELTVPGLGARPLLFEPQMPSTLYAGGFGVHKSIDGGTSWALNIGGTDRNVTSLAIDPEMSATLYAGTFGSVMRSMDEGTTWSNHVLPLGSNVLALAVSPVDHGLVFVGVDGVGIVLARLGEGEFSGPPPPTPTDDPTWWTPTPISDATPPTPTPTPTPVIPGSPVPTPSGGPAFTPTSTATPDSSESPSPTGTFTPTSSATSTYTVTGTSTSTTVTPTRTVTRTPTFTTTPTRTLTRTPTTTVTPTRTLTRTQTRTFTAVPTPTVRVSGIATNAVTGARLSGVVLSLAGQSTTSDASGFYNFPSIDQSRGRTLTATRAGFNPYSVTLAFPTGALALTHDVRLAPQASRPVVTDVQPQYGGLFVTGPLQQNQFIATVAWNGTPGTVEFYANNQLRQTVPGTASGASATFNMGADFPGSLVVGANRVRVIARNAEGLVSDAFARNVTVLPLPPALAAALSQFQVQRGPSDLHLALDLSVPQPPIAHTIMLPVIGRWGVEMAGNVSFDYTVRDGDWEAAIGVGAEGRQGKRGRRPTIPGLTRSPRMKLYFGNKEANFSVQGGARGTATVASGIQLSQAFLGIGLGLKVELGRVGVLDLLSPGISTFLSPIPGLHNALKAVSVIFYVEPQFNGQANFALNPQLAFQSLDASGSVGVSAAYEPNLGAASMRLYLGGRPTMTVRTPGQLIRSLNFRAYAGAEFEWWLVRLGPFEYVFVDRTITPGAGAVAFGAAPDFTIERVAHDGAELRAIPRNYLDLGPPVFTGNAAPSALGQGGAAAATSPVHQVDLTLVENVFPNSQPAMAAAGDELLLVYVSDNGMGGALQRTDINWMRFDGAAWSAPAPILADTRAEFRPQVAFDANGDAIAVWERVKDPQFDTLDVAAMAAEMEIVWSRWERTSGAWTAPAPLTDNAHLDHQPLLAGPMADGSLLLAWTENRANQPIGTGGAGDDAADAVRWSRWDAETQSWSASEILVADLAVRTSQAFAGAGGTAVYAWTLDADGDLEETSDQELYYATWTGSGWTAPAQLTSDAIADRHVRAVVDAAEQISLVWQRGPDLVLDRNLSGTPVLARADSQTVAFADYAMTAGPNGNLALLWQEQSESGVDAHYAVYDPATGRWSEDIRLFEDADLERSFAPVWDAGGALTIAYNRVQITTGSKTVTTEGGETLEIDNVPQPGRVDLAVVRRALLTDLALRPGDLTVDGESFLPGSTVILSATVRNAGDLPLENVEVAFYDGDPAAGGVEILPRQIIGGFLDGGATAEVTAEWVIPEPALLRTLYAVLDPDERLPDADRANNRLSLVLGGTDLVVRLIASEVGSDGSARVIVSVANEGAPGAPPSVLAIRYDDSPAGDPLATAQIPALAPGAHVEAALDLSPGSVAEERLFRISADDGEDVDDADRENNAITFAMESPEPSAPVCPGDCNGDGAVTVNELIRGVNIALGNLPLTECPPFDRNGDGSVTVSELIAAVNNALNGC